MDETISDSTFGTFLVNHFDVVIRGIKLVPGDWEEEIIDRLERVNDRGGRDTGPLSGARMDRTSYATIQHDTGLPGAIGHPIVMAVPPT